jgi:hypothetical protein
MHKNDCGGPFTGLLWFRLLHLLNIAQYSDATAGRNVPPLQGSLLSCPDPGLRPHCYTQVGNWRMADEGSLCLGLEEEVDKTGR